MAKSGQKNGNQKPGKPGKSKPLQAREVRKRQDRIRIAAIRAVVKVDGDLGQTKHMTRKGNDRAMRPGQGKARS